MDAPLRWLPVHPARRRTTAHGQVSWLPDRYRRSAFPVSASGVVERGSPVTVAGAARAFPLHRQETRFPQGPVSRTIHDVGASLVSSPGLSSFGTPPPPRVRRSGIPSIMPLSD